MNLFHIVITFSSICLNIFISNVSATGPVVAKSIVESHVAVIPDDDLFNMDTFTFDGTGSAGSKSAVFTKIRSSRRILENGLEEVIWEGAIIDSKETGFATLLRHDQGPVVASFTTNEAAYELDTAANGTVVLTSILWEDVVMGSYIEAPEDALESAFNILPTSEFAAAGISYPDNSGTVTSSLGKAASLVNSTTPTLRSRELQAGPVVDVMVIVTNRAMCRAASLADGCALTETNKKPVEDKIVLANQQTNSAVQGVGISLSFRTVLVVHVTPEFDANPDEDALNFLRFDPFARFLIDQVGADLVAMLTGSIPSGKLAGIAYVNGPESVSSVDYLSSYVFTHELGHNFGAYHDRSNCANSHPYAHAIQVPNQFRTVMALDCPSGISCPVIPFFSNPNYTYNGFLMGEATKDNARRIQETAPIVASWKQATVPAPIPIPGFVPVSVPAPVPRPVSVPVPVPRPAPVPVPRPAPVPVPVPYFLWCGVVTPECPNSNLMKRQRLFFGCIQTCLSNTQAKRTRTWTCGGC